jgi:hypothetical protein
MDALHVRPGLRFGPIFEWLVAAVILFLAMVTASKIVGELRVAPVLEPAPVSRPLVATIPPAVPMRAVSVPILPFNDGKEIRVGETVSAVATRLGRSAEVGRQEIDRGTVGERLTRFYEYAGSRFILVFEPLERNGEARLAAIYLP